MGPHLPPSTAFHKGRLARSFMMGPNYGHRDSRFFPEITTVFGPKWEEAQVSEEVDGIKIIQISPEL
ncbi:hypothetical protein PGTUg99_001803 [Puccinia graminis f. sp. tritici]|uniref:Uncharacterized protein n=1 Tax=Puccinia graminis f. sp. tritici TaxID=56615 RepID=A0A5B0QU41_PUCGR|nr:hypothetical protein PGTUg99_001803 [Puccinia graminis f. sp. tritici]